MAIVHKELQNKIILGHNIYCPADLRPLFILEQWRCLYSLKVSLILLGIKTKLVESLSFDTPSISFSSGAIGVPLNVTGGKLVVVPDSDIFAFGNAVSTLLKQPNTEL